MILHCHQTFIDILGRFRASETGSQYQRHQDSVWSFRSNDYSSWVPTGHSPFIIPNLLLPSLQLGSLLEGNSRIFRQAAGRQAGTQACWLAGWLAGRQAGRQAGRLSGKQAGRKRGKQGGRPGREGGRERRREGEKEKERGISYFSKCKELSMKFITSCTMILLQMILKYFRATCEWLHR